MLTVWFSRYSLPALFAFLAGSISNAQVLPDSVRQGVDTIIIYSEPVIIKQPVYRNIPPAIPKPRKLFAELSVLPMYSFMHYSSCDCYGNYLERYKKSTHSSISYAAQGNISYLKKHIYTSFGLGYVDYRYSFNHSVIDQGDKNKTSINFRYLTIDLQGGYRVEKKKWSYIFVGGLTLQNFLSANGKSFYNPTDSTYAINKVTQDIFLRQYSWSINTGVKLLYKLPSRMYLIVEPFYMFDLASVTRKPSFFYVQKNTLGLRIGWWYEL